jgi:hypothetical protein
VLACGLDGQGFDFWQGQKTFLYFIISKPWGPSELLFNEQLGCEAGNSPPSTAEVKNGGTLPEIPHCLHRTVLNYLSVETTLPNTLNWQINK